jgi:hypothetical protein
MNMDERIASHEARLYAKHRANFVGGVALRAELGFRTGTAFRLAASQGRLPIPTFIQTGRRGRFARVHDLAVWLAGIDAQIEAQQPTLLHTNSTQEAANEPPAHK